MENEHPFSLVTPTDATGLNASIAFWLFETALSICVMSVVDTWHYTGIA